MGGLDDKAYGLLPIGRISIYLIPDLWDFLIKKYPEVFPQDMSSFLSFLGSLLHGSLLFLFFGTRDKKDDDENDDEK